MSEDSSSGVSLSQTVADLSAAVSSIQRQQERLLDVLSTSQLVTQSQSAGSSGKCYM